MAFCTAAPTKWTDPGGDVVTTTSIPSLRAIRIAHRTVHRGIDVGAPVLALCSARSSVLEQWADDAMRTDTVLDVGQIAKWSHRLGSDVTVVRVGDAIHDVFLSAKEVRQVAFDRVDRWLSYALP